MNELYPSTASKRRPAVPKVVPPHSGASLRTPENYIADRALVDAVNIALMLSQPLIVTGEPGTGKTVLASSVAWELGLDPPLVFETKSTAQARDLFYIYDTLGRFTAKELRTDAAHAKDYITFNALGAAIVLANEPEAVADILPAGFTHPGRRRSVVLIDEVEKAPRDFPNDILNEIERMYFRIPELGNRWVHADEAYAPIVVMTNNSEKSLPDAFLRRCIYYHITFPIGPRLEEIVVARLPEFAAGGGAGRLAASAIDFLLHVREDAAALEKRPGTAEFLNWLTAMTRLGADPTQPLATQSSIAERALPALAKISGDQARTRELLWNWTNRAGKS